MAILLLGAVALWAAGPAVAGTCTSLQDCSLGNTPLAAVIGVGIASLLGLVCMPALDGAFGPWTADGFAVDEAEPAAEPASARAPGFTAPRRTVDMLPEAPGPEPEYGPDRHFLRPPAPREEEAAPPQDLFRPDAAAPALETVAPDAEKDEKFSAAAGRRDLFDDKLDSLAKAYKPDDADYAKVAVTLDDDGTPSDGSINYFNRRFDNTLPIYKVSVDAEGDPVGAASTAAGRAFQALQGFLPEGPYTVAASYAQDAHGNSYIDRVRVSDENEILRADLQFNEDGHAWLGERFDAEGKRVGVIDNPDMAPGGGPRHTPPLDVEP